MCQQRLAREQALKLLFEQEFHSSNIDVNDLSSILQRLLKDSPDISSTNMSMKYSKNLFQGIQKQKNKIDDLIAKASQSWKLNRMPLVDLNIMRIAVYEMLWHTPTIPFKVCINEAIEIAKEYGTADSASFINGILHTIFKNRQVSE